MTQYDYATTGGAAYGGGMSALAAARDGSLWIGLRNDGALHFIPGPGHKGPAGGKWLHYTSGGGLSFDQVTAILGAPDGSVWLGNEQGGLARCVAQP